MITITLNEILNSNPCASGFLRVLHARGKITTEQLEYINNEDYEYANKLPEYILSMSDDESFPAADVVKSENFYDALWALHIKPEHQNLWCKYAVWCARQIEHLMTDERSINAISVAWRHADGLATDEELAAARDAASAAARDAERAAERAERAAAWDAARDAAMAAAMAARAAARAARAAAWDAARAAEMAAAWDAEMAARDAARARDAAWDAARAAEMAAAWDAEMAARDAARARDAQCKKLIQILTAGEWVD